MRVQPLPLLTGAILALACVAVAALALGRADGDRADALVAAARHVEAARTPLLTAEDVEGVIPAIRARAATAARGTVRGPAVKLTATTVHLRLRRGACRVHLAMPRAAPPAAAVSAAVVTLGSGCARR